MTMCLLTPRLWWWRTTPSFSCRRDQTLKRDLREISEELTTLDLPASGVIFNCARESKKSLERSNYYYYYSDRNKEHRKKRRFSLK